MPYSVAEPRLTRDIELHFAGDWGTVNLHRICGWLSQEMTLRAGPGTRIAIWTGKADANTVTQVIDDVVDVAFSVPGTFAALAAKGHPPFKSPQPRLRSLGVLPQNDRLICAVRADLGIRSFADIRERKAPLRISVGLDDGLSAVGFAAQRLMERSGIPRQTLESWGGRFIENERARGCVTAVKEGLADAVIHEAVMTAYWKDLADTVDLAFLDFEQEALDAMKRDFGWPEASLPTNYLRGMTKPYRALDFSDFVAMVRDDMPEDIAYLLTWCMCETRDIIHAQYAHIQPGYRAVSTPLDPARIARSPIPLHPGAVRYYRQAGIAMDPWRPPEIGPR